MLRGKIGLIDCIGWARGKQHVLKTGNTWVWGKSDKLKEQTQQNTSKYLSKRSMEKCDSKDRNEQKIIATFKNLERKFCLRKLKMCAKWSFENISVLYTLTFHVCLNCQNLLQFFYFVNGSFSKIGYFDCIWNKLALWSTWYSFEYFPCNK